MIQILRNISLEPVLMCPYPERLVYINSIKVNQMLLDAGEKTDWFFDV